MMGPMVRPLRTPLVRAFWLTCAVLQLGLPGSAALADAVVDTGAAGARVHIESHTTAACARIHPPDCALCRFLGMATLTGHAPARIVTLGPVPAALVATSVPAALRTIPPLPQPRAPPTLS